MSCACPMAASPRSSRWRSRSAARCCSGAAPAPPIFFNDLNGDWTTSTYYMNALPAWLVAFNAKRLADQWFGKEWTRCLPEAVYGPEPDDAPWEADQLGLGRTFPAQDHRRGAEADRQVLGGFHDLGFRHRPHLRVRARRRRGRGARPGRDHRRPGDLGQPDRSYQATRSAPTRTRSETRSSAPIARSASSSLISTIAWASAAGSPW